MMAQHRAAVPSNVEYPTYLFVRFPTIFTPISHFFTPIPDEAADRSSAKRKGNGQGNNENHQE